MSQRNVLCFRFGLRFCIVCSPFLKQCFLTTGSGKGRQRLTVQKIPQGLQSGDRNPRHGFLPDLGTYHRIQHPVGNPTARPIEGIDNYAWLASVAVMPNDSDFLPNSRMMAIMNLNARIVSSV